DFVDAPPQLARRLAQIGLVDAGDGERLRRHLKPGQRLVSREGALWRWDGFVAATDAPTPAAQRLAQKNRLAELEAEVEAAAARLQQCEEEARQAEALVAGAVADERQARDWVRDIR